MINCCEEDNLDEATHYELSDDDAAVVTIADDLEHAEVMKKWTDCSVDIA